jgi:hypothetical protein
MHWLIFVILGPLIGFVTVLGAFIGLSGTSYPSDWIVEALPGLPLAYLYGVIPALMAAFAVRQLQVRQTSHE